MRKEEAEVKNEADQLVFMTEKTLKDLEDKVSEEEKKSAEDAKEELKAALEAGNLEDIKTKKDKLNEIVQQLTMKLMNKHKQMLQLMVQQAGPTDDGVVDAEFEEVNDDKDKSKIVEVSVSKKSKTVSGFGFSYCIGKTAMSYFS